MTLAIIAAHDPNLLIGAEGGLPWHYKEDMQWFKRVTMGCPVIMGRGVYEEVGEKPLPGRRNIVLTRSRTYDNVEVCTAIDDALQSVQTEDLVFIIGGGEIYKQVMDDVDKLYITEIHKEYEGDTFFPEYRDDVGTVWKEVSRDDRGEISFVVYERVGDT